MPKPLSNETREKIIMHKQNNVKESDIAKWLIISKSVVTKTWKLYKTTGSWQPLPQNAGRKPLINEANIQKIKNKIAESSDITLQELIDEFSLPVSQSALCRTLKGLGLSYKKRHYFQKTNNEKTSNKNVKNGAKIKKI